jgi:hypothetical protein
MNPINISKTEKVKIPIKVNPIFDVYKWCFENNLVVLKERPMVIQDKTRGIKRFLKVRIEDESMILTFSEIGTVSQMEGK